MQKSTPTYVIWNQKTLYVMSSTCFSGIIMDKLIQALINTAKAHDANEAHRLELCNALATEGEMVQKLVKSMGYISMCGRTKKNKSCSGNLCWGNRRKSFCIYYQPSWMGVSPLIWWNQFRNFGRQVTLMLHEHIWRDNLLFKKLNQAKYMLYD